MVEVSPEQCESIGRYLNSISPATNAALSNYELLENLFLWHDVLETHN